MFDFVTVLGSITDILVTELKVRTAAIVGPSECHYNCLLYVTIYFTIRVHCMLAAAEVALWRSSML